MQLRGFRFKSSADLEKLWVFAAGRDKWRSKMVHEVEAKMTIRQRFLMQMRIGIHHFFDIFYG